MKIVFFDSGVGGLTVLHEALELMPYEDYIYYADTDNVPYGTKSPEQVKKLVFEAIEKLNRTEIKALVLACNTATSIAVEELRNTYSFHIIGMEPAVKPASLIGNKKILVCATDNTLKQDKLVHLIDTLEVNDRIKMLSLQELVGFAEAFNFQSPKAVLYLRSRFEKINWEIYDSLVLGCTHFLYFRKQIRSLVPEHVQIFDGNKGTVARLCDLIKRSNPKKGNIDFLVSGRMDSIWTFDNYIRYYKEQTVS